MVLLPATWLIADELNRESMRAPREEKTTMAAIRVTRMAPLWVRRKAARLREGLLRIPRMSLAAAHEISSTTGRARG